MSGTSRILAVRRSNIAGHTDRINSMTSAVPVVCINMTAHPVITCFSQALQAGIDHAGGCPGGDAVD